MGEGPVEPAADRRGPDTLWDAALPIEGNEEAIAEYVDGLETVVVTRYLDGQVLTDTDLDDETAVFLLTRAIYLIQRGVNMFEGEVDDDGPDEEDEDADA